jgi:hypothetical protein
VIEQQAIDGVMDAGFGVAPVNRAGFDAGSIRTGDRDAACF